MKKQSFTDSKQCMAFLAARYKIPKPMLEQIRAIMIQDSLTDSESLAYNRIYTAVALMLHDHLHFGQKRLLAALRCFDGICGRVMDDEVSWPELMKELDEKTGLIIRKDEDDKLLMEYQTPEEIITGDTIKSEG